MKAVGILYILFVTVCVSPSFAQISKERDKEHEIIKIRIGTESYKSGKKAAKKIVHEDLDNKGDKLHKDLGKLSSW